MIDQNEINQEALLQLLRRQVETPLESTYAEVELSENIPFSRDKEAYAAVKMTVKVNGRIGVGANPTLAILVLNHIAMTALDSMRTGWILDAGTEQSLNLTAPAELMLNPQLILESQRSHPVEMIKGVVSKIQPSNVKNWVRFEFQGTDRAAFLSLADLSRLMGQELANEIKAVMYDGDGVYEVQYLGATARRQSEGYYKVVDVYPVGIE